MYHVDYGSDYKILGVTLQSNVSEIKTNYRTLAKIYHPDNIDTGDAEKFKLLNSAYMRIINLRPNEEHSQKATPKPTPSEDVNKYLEKNRIFRVLDPTNKKNEHTIGFPGSNITPDIVFHFLWDYDQFNLFIDQEITLPTTLKITYRDKTVTVRVVESWD